MKTFKKVVSLVLAGVLLMGTSINTNAAERHPVISNYVPDEESNADILIDLAEMELQNGEKIVIGEYTIEFQEETICLNPYSRATTKDFVNTSIYKISHDGIEQDWYKVVQTTNYTYDGKTAKINTDSCLLTVTTYYPECNYTIDTNTVDNSSSTAPTYTIGLTMDLMTYSISIVDVVTINADGTHNLAHYS